MATSVTQGPRNNSQLEQAKARLEETQNDLARYKERAQNIENVAFRKLSKLSIQDYNKEVRKLSKKILSLEKDERYQRKVVSLMQNQGPYQQKKK